MSLARIIFFYDCFSLFQRITFSFQHKTGICAKFLYPNDLPILFFIHILSFHPQHPLYSPSSYILVSHIFFLYRYTKVFKCLSSYILVRNSYEDSFFEQIHDWDLWLTRMDVKVNVYFVYVLFPYVYFLLFRDLSSLCLRVLLKKTSQ